MKAWIKRPAGYRGKKGAISEESYFPEP